MTDWKPIETAPRDGTQILVEDLSVACIVAWWSSMHSAFVWIHPDLCQSEGTAYLNPTHWMPLPPPPERPE